eukprot:398185_1
MPKRRKNKFDSTYTKKVWQNRHSVKYRWKKRPGYDFGWWTPPHQKKYSKASKKRKARVIRNINKHIIKIEYDEHECNGWIDYDIYSFSDDNYNDDEWYYDYNNIPIWDCPICSYNNIQRLSFCSFCNHPYYHNNHNETVNNNGPNQFYKSHSYNDHNCKDINDNEIYEYYCDHVIKMNKLKRKLFHALLPKNHIQILNANNLQIECMINDYWINKISRSKFKKK